MVPLDKELQWVNVKQKPFRQILAHSGMIKHIQATGIIQAYSKPCVTLAYLEPWYIQDPNIFKIRKIFGTLVYQNPGIFRGLTYSKSKAYSDIYDVKLLLR